MPNYAGEIRIKTAVDLEGIKEGMAQTNSKLKDIAKSIGSGLTKVVGGVAIGVTAALAVVAMGFRAMRKWIDEMGKMDGFKGQVEEVRLAFANLKNAIFSALMPVFNAILPIIMQVVDWLTRAANAAGAFLAALTGSSTYMVYVQTSLEGAEDASGQLADNMEEAEKAAGKLAGFDKLNVLKQDNQSGSGATTPDEGAGGTGSWVEMPIDEGIQEKAKKVREFFEKIKSWAIGLWEGIKNVWSLVSGWFKEKVINPVASFFKDLWENPKETTKKALDAILNFFIKLITVDIPQWGRNLWNWLKENWPKIVEWFSEAFAKIGEFFQEFWRVYSGILSGIWEWVKEKIIDPIAAWFKEKVIDPLTEYFRKLWEDISGFFVSLWNDIKEIWSKVSAWFDEHVIQPVVGFFKELWNKGKEYFTNLWSDVKEVWNKVSTWFRENVTEPVVGFFKGLWESVSGFFVSLWEDIEGVWNTVSSWFDENVVEPVKGFFQGLWESVSGYFANLWEDVKGVWNTVSSWFDTNVIQPVSGFFSGLKETVSGYFTDLWEGIKNVWSAVAGWFEEHVTSPIKAAVNAIIGLVNNMIGGIESGLNWLINGLNSIGFDMPDWLGGGRFGLNIPPVSFGRIPMLATGAVIPPNAPFAAILGDQRSGTNIEAPEGLLRQIVREEMGGINMSGTIKFDIDEGGLIRYLHPKFQTEKWRKGNSMLSNHSGIN